MTIDRSVSHLMLVTIRIPLHGRSVNRDLNDDNGVDACGCPAFYSIF